MKSIFGVAGAFGLALTLAAGQAGAQNIPSNNGVWWTDQATRPGAFVLFNPLTTLYGRIGIHRAWYTADRIGDPSGQFGSTGSTLDEPTGGALALGARVMPVLRVELEAGGNYNAAWRNGPPFIDGWGGGIASFRARAATAHVMANAYVDLAPFFGGLGPFNVFVMGGVGVGINRMGDYCFTFGPPVGCTSAALDTGRTRYNFAWQAGAGVQYQVMANMILELVYGYVDPGRFELGINAGQNVLRMDAAYHRVGLGLVVPFDGLVRAFGN